jgi:hypothetical protein
MFTVREELGSIRREMTCGFILMTGCHVDMASLHSKTYRVYDCTYYYYYYYYYLLQLCFHPVAVVLTLVHTIQMEI